LNRGGKTLLELERGESRREKKGWDAYLTPSKLGANRPEKAEGGVQSYPLDPSIPEGFKEEKSNCTGRGV